MTAEIQIIDSHTAGEPTRVVMDGGPSLGDGPIGDRVELFRQQHDRFRSAIVKEPRGHDVMVGALLCTPSDPTCETAVIFFNNVGYLPMCGHGMIGVVESLRFLGRIEVGVYRIETPAGVVTAKLNEDQSVSIRNVASFRTETNVRVQVDGVGTVLGDVAWGGNWFFLVKEPREELSLARVRHLQEVAVNIRREVNASGFPEVDHVELFGDSEDHTSNSKNFVLCPGLEYDRSPCGTGTSAKLACLAAEGLLSPGETWVQEGILGTKFLGQYEWSDDSKQRIDPTITGHAFVTAKATLILGSRDPFRWGFLT